jgi:Superinfection immunity protein
VLPVSQRNAILCAFGVVMAVVAFAVLAPDGSDNFLRFGVIAFGLYFLPAIIALVRDVPSKWSVVVINVFLGWTLIGWVVALAMAARSVPPRSRHPDTVARAPRPVPTSSTATAQRTAVDELQALSDLPRARRTRRRGVSTCEAPRPRQLTDYKLTFR